VAVGFNLWVLRAERLAVVNLNDSAMHAQMVRFAAGQLDRGRLPLSAWYPYFGFGSPHFHHYQTLGHELTGGVAALFGVGPDQAFGWALYLLLALWPVAVYGAARLFGWSRWVAAGAALLAPLLVSTPGYGYEHGSYVWQGYGMWTQLWGMWLLPLAWALSYRAVSRGRDYAWAAAAIALTIALHFLTGYQAVLAVAVWVPLRPRQAARRLARALVVWAGAALAAAWVVVPLLRDAPWANQSTFFRHTYFNDSYGARRILGWLVTGDLYDAGRLPVVTGLVAVGLAVCLARARRDERARALVAIWVAALLLYFGRPTWGGALRLLPGSDDLLFHRFVMGVHLSGLLLAGVGGEWLVRAVPRLAAARRPALRWPAAAGVAVIALVALLPAWRAVSGYDARGRAGIVLQRQADRTDGANVRALADAAVRRGGGRVYAGSRANWGTRYVVGAVPVYAELAARDADAVGFTFRTAGLSTDVEALFDETKPEHYRLFGVRYLLLPPDREPAVPATLLAQLGRHRLFEVTGAGGYVEVADAATVVTTDRAHVAAAAAPFLGSTLVREGVFPTVAFGGRAAAPATVSVLGRPAGPAGRVEQEVDLGADGRYAARVVAARPAIVVLKASYDPHWHATVDGHRVRPFMVAPSFVAVAVPAGGHAVEFAYGGYPGYPLLFALGLLALGALVALGRMGSGPLARERQPGGDAFADPGRLDVPPPVARPEPGQRPGQPAEVGAVAVDQGAEGDVDLDRRARSPRDTGPVLDQVASDAGMAPGDRLELGPEPGEVGAAGHGERGGVDAVPDERLGQVPGLAGRREGEPEIPVGGVPEVLAEPPGGAGGRGGEDDGGHGEEVLHEQHADHLGPRDEPGPDGDPPRVPGPPGAVEEPAAVHEQNGVGGERRADGGQPAG
jgi:hypothetical protein